MILMINFINFMRFMIIYPPFLDNLDTFIYQGRINIVAHEESP